MAITSLLSVDVTSASSSDLVVAAGTPVAVSLKNTAAPVPITAKVLIELKDDAGVYYAIGYLTGEWNKHATLISAPGTYRFTRVAGAACGVFSA
jgi:hypothetical protein